MAGEKSMEGRTAAATETAREERANERAVDRLERKVDRLGSRFERVAETARKREEDFGLVRSQSKQVPKLREEIRKLAQTVQELTHRLANQEREIGRLTKRLESRRGDTAPAPHTEVSPPKVVERAPARQPERDPGRTFGRVAGRIPSEDEIRAIAQKQVRDTLAGRSIADLIAEVRPGLGAKIQKLTPLLERMGIDLDAGTIMTAVIDALLDRIDLDEIIGDVVSRLRSGDKRPRY